MLYAALARIAKQCMGEFNAQALANTARAFAKSDQAEDPVLAALARTAKRLMGEFNAQAFANTAWAFPMLD